MTKHELKPILIHLRHIKYLKRENSKILLLKKIFAKLNNVHYLCTIKIIKRG